MNFIDKYIYIETDLQKSKQITDKLCNNISYDMFYNAYQAFLSTSSSKEINILKYICLGFLIGSKAGTMLSVEYVFEVNSLRRQVGLEAHRLKGLLRFISISEHTFYATLHPDNNVLAIVGHHFIKRLPKENFIIVDKIRNIAFIYNTKEYRIVDTSYLNIPDISEEEKMYQTLWKTFFHTIAITERTNSRLQASFMPRRYWQDLIEEP